MPSGRRQGWDFELRKRRRTVDPWGASAEGAQARQRHAIDDSGGTEAVVHLEPLDGGLGSRPEQSVDGAEFVAEAAEHPLDLENGRRTARTSVAGTWANGGRGSAAGQRGGAQRCSGLRADDAVDHQVVRFLEAPNGPFRQRTVDAIDRAGRVSPIAQCTLELPYLR
jgi:hypothetical protein